MAQFRQRIRPTIDKRGTRAARCLHVLVRPDVRLPLRELERFVRLALERGVGVELLCLLLRRGDGRLRMVPRMLVDVRLVLVVKVNFLQLFELDVLKVRALRRVRSRVALDFGSCSTPLVPRYTTRTQTGRVTHS